MTKELVDQKINNVPDFLKGKENQGRGNENLTSEDIKPNRLILCQKLTTESVCSKQFKAGDIVNTYDDSVRTEMTLCFIKFEPGYVVREAGSTGLEGLKGYFNTKHAAENVLNSEPNLKMNPSFKHYCLAIDGDDRYPVVLPITTWGTFKQSHKQLNTLFTRLSHDRFAYKIKVSTIKDPTHENNYIYSFSLEGFVDANTYKEAERLYEVSKTQKNEETIDNSEY